MLTKAQNERLTKVGPGTTMGTLMRYYWHPIAASVELDENPVKKIRLLGEDLVLYKDRSGNLGLIDEPCPHRRVSLEYGIPEEEGLRCPYHGWVFNSEGKCTEQPAEPWNSTFKDRVTTKAYPAQELGGLVFAYLGEAPVPLLPRYDVYVWDNMVRHIGVTVLPCNFLQCMENSLDPVHAEWLHGYYHDYVMSRNGTPRTPNSDTQLRGTHKKIGFDRFEHGIIKRRVMTNETEEDTHWRQGHPIIFPYMLRIGAASDYSFQIRVPMDDTHTYHIHYLVYRPGIPLPPQESVPMYDIPLKDENDKFITDFVIGQDHFAWASQGSIAQRDKEKLGQSDVGIIMYREMLLEQIDRAERGVDPIEVYRDPAENQLVLLPQEGAPYGASAQSHGRMFRDPERSRNHMRFNPRLSELEAIYQEAAQQEEAGATMLPPPQLPLVDVGVELHKTVQIQP